MIQHITLRNSGGGGRGFNTGYSSSRPSALHAVPSPSRDARHIDLQDPLSKNINSQEGRREGKVLLEGVESMYRGFKDGSMLGGGGVGAGWDCSHRLQDAFTAQWFTAHQSTSPKNT